MALFVCCSFIKAQFANIADKIYKNKCLPKFSIHQNHYLLFSCILCATIGIINNTGDDFMAQTTFSIRMDENLKKQFDELCAEFGMNVTTAFTIFAKAVVREREIPFKITSEHKDPTLAWPPEYWAEVRAKLEEAEADVAAGRTMDAFKALEKLGTHYGV